MKRIAVIEGSYVRDAQVFNADPAIIDDDPNWDENYSDLSCCHFIGIFDGNDEEAICNKAADCQGVHPDVISLIPLKPTENESTDMVKFEFDSLNEHVGHQTEIVTYGGDWNVAIECVDCCQVLYSVDNPGRNGVRNE